MATICLDNNFISDYLNDAQYTAEFLRGFGPQDDVLLPTSFGSRRSCLPSVPAVAERPRRYAVL